MIHFKINIAAPSLNEWYSGKHWSYRKRIADAFHRAVKVACRKEKIQPIVEYPVKITTKSLYKKKRAYDVINCCTASKLAEDGLVRAGILKNDTPQYVAGHEILKPVFGHTEDATLIIIEAYRDKITEESQGGWYTLPLAISKSLVHKRIAPDYRDVKCITIKP